MSENLRKEAEWVIQASEFIYHHQNFAAIAAGVANAYLAEHPADNNIELESKWLGSACRFQSEDEWSIGEGRTFVICLCGDRLFRLWIFDRFTGLILSTRGDVRRLARALRIDLKEVAQ